jgi:hypothetical protein
MTPAEELERSLAAVLTAFVIDLDEAQGEEKEQEARAKASTKILDLFCGRGVQLADSPPVQPARYRMPDERIGVTCKLRIHAKDDTRKFYLTLGRYRDGRLGEVFIREVHESGGYTGGLLDAMATCLSIGLQHGIPWSEFASKLSRQRFEPAGATDCDNPSLRFVSSPVDLLARFVSAKEEEWGKP